ncbi:hypothetical protein [Limnobacter parvus]|uniref:Lipoprotein n=1 Tax=Limnobacter parvus TaxID=2939690 RepID=A0ABT1XI71_9BURK|nr:hypothetical protein [Limnobacter parvus]MCR2746283.1 hypothetical protein [Limnobacter parvus]
MKKLKILMVASAATMLSSCDLSQIPGLDGKLSIEDSKAVGAACRHSGRALEDCFTMNPNTYQSGVFEGWREMNDYMIANGLDVVKPEIRNSAFKPEPTSMNQGALAAPEQTAGTEPAGESLETVPLAQGRQRWVPKGVESPANVTPQPEVAAGKVEDDLPEPATLTEEPATEKAPAQDLPARPWERKKDPKKHT